MNEERKVERIEKEKVRHKIRWDRIVLFSLNCCLPYCFAVKEEVLTANNEGKAIFCAT
jgi:hypothetical protein